MAVTIRDVAKKAGVSASTVSIVYNAGPNATRISAPTRARVEAAIRELHYEPNAIARSTSLKRFEALGVALLHSAESLGPGFTYTQAIAGIGISCATHNYLCVIGCLDRRKPEIPKFLRPRCVDLVLALHQLDSETHDKAVHAGIPVMLVNAAPMHDLACVNFDDAGAGRSVMNRLGELGHRRIAYINNYMSTDHYSGQVRQEAYISWCKERGLPTWIYNAPSERTWSSDDTAALVQWVKGLAEAPEPVTAIVGYAEFELFALLRALPAAGISVPGQVSLVAFAGELEGPRAEIAGAVFNAYDLGIRAADEAVAALWARRAPQSHVLPAIWRETHTVGPARTV